MSILQKEIKKSYVEEHRRTNKFFDFDLERENLVGLGRKCSPHFPSPHFSLLNQKIENIQFSLISFLSSMFSIQRNRPLGHRFALQ